MEQSNNTSNHGEYPLQEKLTAANAFFEPAEAKKMPGANSGAFSLDGFVQYLCFAVTTGENPAAKAKVAELENTVIALMSVVAVYVERWGQSSLTDIDLWAEAVNHLPLMSRGQVSGRWYDRTLRGTAIPGEIINEITGGPVRDDATFNSYKHYLGDAARNVKRGIDSTRPAYKTLTIGLNIESLGGERYRAGVKLYRVDFVRENGEWISSCGSENNVAMRFDYSFFESSFDYDAFNNREAREQLNYFIKNMPQKPINQDRDFFKAELVRK